MSDLSVSSSDGVFFDETQDMKESLEIDKLAEKIQSIWGQIYEAASGCVSGVIHVARDAIGSVVCNAFFFPLKWSVIANSQEALEQLPREEKYYRDFWDPEKPLDPSLSLHGEIRDKFLPPQNRDFSIVLKNGKTVKITCQIVETKQQGGPFYQFAQVPGIYTTISNNIATTYPYLAAYLNHHKKEDSLPPARFIMISENDLDCKPKSLDEAGFILLETLKILKEEFGEFDQLVAHSLGTVFLSSALRQAEDPQFLPKHICFDRGPTSIWEVSKKYFFGWGHFLYFLAKCGRWASDTEQEIVDFCQKWKERPTLLITGTLQDHHFSGGANLCLGEKIKKIEQVRILVFDPVRQLFHQIAHHNLRPDFFTPWSLVMTNSSFMEPWENLSEAIIRHSLPTFEKKYLQS